MTEVLSLFDIVTAKLDQIVTTKLLDIDVNEVDLIEYSDEDRNKYIDNYTKLYLMNKLKKKEYHLEDLTNRSVKIIGIYATKLYESLHSNNNNLRYFIFDKMAKKKEAENTQISIENDIHRCSEECDEECDIDGTRELSQNLYEINTDIMIYFAKINYIPDENLIIKIISYFNQYNFKDISDHNYIKQMSYNTNYLLRILIENNRLDILYILENRFNYPFETLYHRDFVAIREMVDKNIQNTIVDTYFLERIVNKRYKFNVEEKKCEDDRQRKQYGGYYI